MAKYQRTNVSTIQNSERLSLQVDLPMAELLAGARADIEALSAQIGLSILRAVMEREVQLKVGEWGRQRLYRHGSQKGYVVYAGRKLAIEHPRVRDPQRGEVPLESYQSFQQDGRIQRAVARRVIRQCSMRHYEGALDECLIGYGIKKSSVSRQFKLSTAKELKELLERPVPKDLVALVIDAKYFPSQCIIVVIGIDKEGRKHVLGLWEGATENAAVCQSLLANLQSRGLRTDRSLLVILDGALALRLLGQDRPIALLLGLDLLEVDRP